MTDLPPLPEAATTIYPIEEPPHDHAGEPLGYAMDADPPEPVRLTGEAKALLGVTAALALGAVTAIAALVFRKRPEPKPAARRRKATAHKPARRASA